MLVGEQLLAQRIRESQRRQFLLLCLIQRKDIVFIFGLCQINSSCSLVGLDHIPGDDFQATLLRCRLHVNRTSLVAVSFNVPLRTKVQGQDANVPITADVQSKVLISSTYPYILPRVAIDETTSLRRWQRSQRRGVSFFCGRLDVAVGRRRHRNMPRGASGISVQRRPGRRRLVGHFCFLHLVV